MGMILQALNLTGRWVGTLIGDEVTTLREWGYTVRVLRQGNGVCECEVTR